MMAWFWLPILPSFLLAMAILLVPIISIWALTYAFERRKQLESHASFPTMAVLDDSTSLSKVPCPSIFDPASKYFSLIMPAYNESSRLPPTLDETLGYLQHRANSDKSFTYEIIIVDDGSTDNTVKVAYEYVHKYSFDVVRVVKLGSNLGKGAAVKKGMLCARGELLLMLDSDGATRIMDLEKLEKEINSLVQQKASRSSPNGKMQAESKENEAAAAFGSRAHLEKHALATRKWYRNLLMKGFHLCVLFVAGHGIRDTQCGFKMFTRAAARELFVNMRLRRWCFDVELCYLSKRLQIPIKEVAVSWMEIPGSKVRITSIFHMLIELALILFGYGFHIWKIQRAIIQR